MTHPTGQFPNETYLNGLRDNPDSTFAVLYDEFRAPILRALAGAGATAGEEALYFQAAVMDAARLAKAGQLPGTVPFFFFLKALALAHFRDEHQRPAPPPAPDESADVTAHLPAPVALQETRLKMLAWTTLEALDAPCQEQLLTAAMPEAETLQTCLKQWQEHLQQAGAPEWADAPWLENLRRDAAHHAHWQRTQALEREWADAEPEIPEPNRSWRWAFFALLAVALGYAAYQYFYHPKTAAEVFADNFAPPPSLMEDMKTRYGAEMGNDSVTAHPGECMLLLREADNHYRAKDYEGALDPLLLIVLDSTSICQSDAWYFLGIIQLKLEDPATAIQCFAKIEDLGRYGEDLYWYQALAFVQLAKENPLMRDKARRAVERTLGNTRDPQRRTQAETMLQQLSQ